MPTMCRLARASGWLLVLSVACGGRVDGGGSRDPEGGTADPAPDEVANDADEGKPGLNDPQADTELGSCVLGSPENYDRACPWVAKDRCYDTREMACNCACPRSRDSQCISGFGTGEFGHVLVSCK